MKKTWYFGALLIAFTFLGIYQNQFSEPNQEIVLKFTDVSVTSDEAQSAIVAVKEQLQTIGISTVRVQELKEGQLKISYYSSVDVESIRKILVEDGKIELGVSQKHNKDLPSEKSPKNYKLDVFEIHKNNDLGSGLDGKYVFNLKQNNERFYNPNVYVFNNGVDADDISNIVKVSFKAFKNSSVAIDNTLGNIPDGRAGPITNGIV
jgi:hypothetical protein